MCDVNLLARAQEHTGVGTKTITSRLRPLFRAVCSVCCSSTARVTRSCINHNLHAHACRHRAPLCTARPCQRSTCRYLSLGSSDLKSQNPTCVRNTACMKHVGVFLLHLSRTYKHVLHYTPPHVHPCHVAAGRTSKISQTLRKCPTPDQPVAGPWTGPCGSRTSCACTCP